MYHFFWDTRYSKQPARSHGFNAKIGLYKDPILPRILIKIRQRLSSAKDRPPSKVVFQQKWSSIKLYVGTVPTLCVFHVGTVPSLCILNVGTVTTLCILNVGTVPTLCILNIGTVPTFSPFGLVLPQWPPL